MTVWIQTIATLEKNLIMIILGTLPQWLIMLRHGYIFVSCLFFFVNDFTANCNLNQALMKFLDKFPQYANNDFYIMGESYAGIYIPTLMKTLSHYPIFYGILKGAAIGNGMLEYRMNLPF